MKKSNHNQLHWLGNKVPIATGSGALPSLCGVSPMSSGSSRYWQSSVADQKQHGNQKWFLSTRESSLGTVQCDSCRFSEKNGILSLTIFTKIHPTRADHLAATPFPVRKNDRRRHRPRCPRSLRQWKIHHFL